MSLEKSLFPFLFPHGCGAYDRSGGFCFIWNRECLHYFLFLHYIHHTYSWCTKFNKQFDYWMLQNIYVWKGMYKNQCQHPQWLEIDVLKNIMKFKLSPSIPLTPQWHHT
jgi:hypothetical protein